MDLYRGVIFAILMQNGNGIMDKSPEYIEEKLYASEHDPYPEGLLDEHNKALLKRWMAFWAQGARKEVPHEG